MHEPDQTLTDPSTLVEAQPPATSPPKTADESDSVDMEATPAPPLVDEAQTTSLEEAPMALPVELSGSEDPSVATLLNELLASISGVSQSLHKVYDDRLAFKEKQIDSLHSELQDYKRGLLLQVTRPLISGLVRLHHDLGRMVEDLRLEPSEALTHERLCSVLEGFQEDVEIVLEENGVVLFSEPGATFDSRRQNSRRTIPTDEETLVGTVAHRGRPGFEFEEKILQKERVDVYVRTQLPLNSTQSET